LSISGIAAVKFESTKPSIVKSIKQRDLLNAWLRLYAGTQLAPAIDDYHPERLREELADLVYYSVDPVQQPPRLTIQSNGTRISEAYGQTGKGRYLDEYVGVRLAGLVMPVYHQCVTRKLPVYSICELDDIHGRVVAYERLLLPFAQGHGVSHVIASVKTISLDGGFEIRNLMRGDEVPRIKFCSVIDQDLFHQMPGRIPARDVIEFN
jgi:hypothetical protein